MSREHFVAVMKRKDIKALGAIILREVYNEEENAKELEDAGRLTGALIERTCIEADEAPVDEAPVDEAPVEEPKEENRSGRIVLDLIADGKFKKAKKAFKEVPENHPEYKTMKKAIKQGLKSA